MKLLTTLALAILFCWASPTAYAQDSEQRAIPVGPLQVGLMKARSAVSQYQGLVRTQNMPYIVDAVFDAAQAHYLITEYLEGEGANDPDREYLELIQTAMLRLGSDISRDVIEQGPSSLRQSGPPLATYLAIVQSRLNRFTVDR